MSFFHIKFWLLYKLRKRKNDICPVVINVTLYKTLEISFYKKKNERNNFYPNFTR